MNVREIAAVAVVCVLAALFTLAAVFMLSEPDRFVSAPHSVVGSE